MVLAPLRRSDEQTKQSNDQDEPSANGFKLSEYEKGQAGIVITVSGNSDYRHRMMEMGFVRGAKVEVIKYAPLADPMELVIKGYHISLRRSEAADIIMSKPEETA